jgi:hypothetical protein
MNLQEKYHYLKKDVEKRKKLHKDYKKQERKLKLTVCDILNEEINSRNFTVSNAIHYRQTKLLNEKEPLFSDIEKCLFFLFFVLIFSFSLAYLMFNLGF